MKIKELIKELKKYDNNIDVCIGNRSNTLASDIFEIEQFDDEVYLLSGD